MRKNIFYYLTLLAFVAFYSCDKKVVVDRGTESELSDIFANIEGYGPARLFEPRFSNDTVYFDIPYYYPIDSDFETDLSKIIVRATISSDALPSIKFGEPMDLTKPLDFYVTSGTGVDKKYVINARKMGDASISEASISYELDGEIQEVEGVLIGDELRFFVLSGLDMSQTTFTFSINKHAASSIVSGSILDLNTPKTVTITAPGNVEKEYKIVLMEPIKLPVGFGINRSLWLKLGAEWDFTGDLETSIAVSGDYLVITTTGTAGNSRYRVFDRFTGEYVRDMKMPFTATSGALSQSNQLVSDEKGQLLAVNRAAYGQVINIYKYTDVFDDNPVLLINTTNVSSELTFGDRSTGRRLNITGDLSADAIITSPASTSKSFNRWEIKNGVLTSQVPTVITISGIAGNHIGYYPEVQYINPSVSSNYLIGQQNDFSYIDASSNEQIYAVSLLSRGNTTFMNTVAIGRFNNATYAFLGRYFSNYTLRRMGLSMFDISNPQMLGTQSSSSLYPSFNVFNSETLIAPLSTTGPGTGDIAVGYSHDGDRMQVYMLHTGYGIWAHEFTVYSAN